MDRCRPNLSGSQRVALQVGILFFDLQNFGDHVIRVERSGVQQKLRDFAHTQVVRQHFGESAEEICDALIKRARRSLKELQQDCQSMPVGQLRNGLLVLIQHNLVRRKMGFVVAHVWIDSKFCPPLFLA